MGARPNTWHNFVRPGLALYGYEQPVSRDGSLAPDVPALPLKPVLAWKTHIIGLRDVPAGQALGYNGAYVTRRPRALPWYRLDTAMACRAKYRPTPEIPLPSLMTTQRLVAAKCCSRGQRAPMVGRISMDLTLVDVTRVPGAAIGDEVVLIGRSGDESISAWDLARSSDTVVYETLCNLSKRVPRRHAE